MSVAQSITLDLDRDLVAPAARDRQPAAGLCGLGEIGRAEWAALAAGAVEDNAFLSPDYYVPLATHAGKAAPCRVLFSRDAQGRLTGLAPLVSARDALRLPVPALIISQPYLPLGTPLLGGSDPVAAASQMIDGAAQAGAALIGFQAMHLDGAVAEAFRQALASRGLEPLIRNAHRRAAFDASTECDAYLRAGLGAKKLKELRRQRNRLGDLGSVEWRVTFGSGEVGGALERFLALEQSGWKGRGGTALGQNPGDAAFIREAAAGCAKSRTLEICELLLDGVPIAAGLVFRSGKTAFFFKTAYDETHMRLSPGVQVTVELTRHLADDPAITLADSVAVSDHPMIDHIWRERIHVGDFYIPTGRGPRPRLAMAAVDARDNLRHAAKQVRNRARAILARRKATPS